MNWSSHCQTRNSIIFIHNLYYGWSDKTPFWAMIEKQADICSSWGAAAGIEFFFFFFFFEDRGLCLISEWDARSQTTAFFPVSFLVATAFQGGLCFCHSFLIWRVLGIHNTCNWRNHLEKFLPFHIFLGNGLYFEVISGRKLHRCLLWS